MLETYYENIGLRGPDVHKYRDSLRYCRIGIHLNLLLTLTLSVSKTGCTVRQVGTYAVPFKHKERNREPFYAQLIVFRFQVRLASAVPIIIMLLIDSLIRADHRSLQISLVD